MSAVAHTHDDTELVMVRLKPRILQKTIFRQGTPEYAMLQELAAKPHPARFSDDGTWCTVEGKPQILAECFDIVDALATA
jgi:hypothetical protein